MTRLAMKGFTVFAFLGLLASGPAQAQYGYQYGPPQEQLRLDGAWDATNYRCNCGNMVQRPSVWGMNFTNPCGQSAAGQWVAPRTIGIPEWGVNATIVDRATIRWSNGCIWHREWQPGF